MQGDRRGIVMAAVAGVAGLAAGAALTVAYQNSKERDAVDGETTIAAESGDEVRPSRRADRSTGPAGPVVFGRVHPPSPRRRGICGQRPAGPTGR